MEQADISPLDREDLRTRVSKSVQSFLASQVDVLDLVSPDVAPLSESVTDLLAGGKRLRPAFCYWGWRGAGGEDSPAAMDAAASLEFLQACALIHDDVMDGSDTRRGMPAAHRRFASLHRGNSWLGSSEAFGLGSAILVGDLCLAWADQMLLDSGLPAAALARGKPVYDEMRVELMAGQYLDLLEQARGGGSVERAMRVVRYKSAKYTIERPLHLGAALAGAPPEIRDAYSAYGLPLGAAFQLRDDVLGVFGDPEMTGKPAGDDLREGKRTVLVAKALEAASPGQAHVLRTYLGDPSLDADHIDQMREIITETGALAQVETLIAELAEESHAAITEVDLHPPAADVLVGLIVAATARKV
ncbi:MAG: polyprenyl synthetase family protein [Actinobacteria bacterium]|nr:polyprenyl synthetase family protein [Actinomycetota bacterium]MCB9412282.1 polyprenyl synthetase family protein [Actinomycetota bacterium]